MALLKSERMEWSLEMQERLQEHLIDQWAADTWDVMEKRASKNKSYLHFSIVSPGLKTELKYAVWYKFTSGDWRLGSDQASFCREFKGLTTWLNIIAPTCPVNADPRVSHPLIRSESQFLLLPCRGEAV